MATTVIEPRYQKPVKDLQGKDLYEETEIRLKIPAMRATDDCRDLAHALEEFLEEEQWQRLEPNWEDFCQQWIGRPAEWVMAIAKGVKLLDPTLPIPAKIALSAAKAYAKQNTLKDNTDNSPGPGRGHKTSLQRKGVLYGNKQSYLLRRIARDAPDILDAYGRGEYLSVRAAAKAAGIIKDKTPKEQLAHWWKKASATERQAFLASIQHDSHAQ